MRSLSQGHDLHDPAADEPPVTSGTTEPEEVPLKIEEDLSVLVVDDEEGVLQVT